jgi:two-component system phosphate regulon sensor histidine kinase PhoR
MNPWPLAGLAALLGFFAGVIPLYSWWRGRWAVLRNELREREQQIASLRKQQDLASADLRTQQETLLNSMPEGVLLLDANGQIQLVNHSLQTMFGLRREVRGQTVLETFRLRPLADLLNRLKTERTVRGFEMELPGVDERCLQVNAATLFDSQGLPCGDILVFHDLTRTKQLENTRQEFVANVSHELRTPLSLIKGYVETLLDGAKDNPELATRFLQTIEKHTDRLTFLIEDLLTVSRLESGQIAMNRQPVELRKEVDRVLDDLRAVATERAIHADNNVPEKLVAVADVDRLEQVLFNLIDNAFKYGRKGGLVQIGARALPDDKVEIWVMDNGPGIPTEAQERIFERFYRVDRARSRETGGTGLGLSIVKHIVQAHGGEVWVKSEFGQGATFFFTLPG